MGEYPTYSGYRYQYAYPEFNCHAGDVIVVARGVGGTGDVKLVREKCYLTNLAIRIELDKHQVDNQFFYYKFLNSGLRHLDSGSAQSQITINDLKNERIDLPAIQRQKEIAGILCSLDDKIHLNQQMNQSLESIAQTIFKSWFVDFDPVKAKMEGREPEGMDAETAALFPDSLVESELGLIPEGWNILNIDDVASITKGKSYKSVELEPSTTALVTLKSFQRGGGYRTDGLKEYTGSFKASQVVNPGDLIVSYTDVTQKAELIGRPAFVYADGSHETYVISLDVAVIRPIVGTSMSKEFLYSVMKTDRFTEHTYSHSTGTTVLHLSKDAVPSYSFAFPGDGLVQRFTEICLPIYQQILVNHQESINLASIRNTLLPKLISGEIQIPTE